MSDAEPRIYAYGIIRLGNCRSSPAPMDGLGGRPVRMIARGGLAALISDLTRQEGSRIDDVFSDPALVKDMVLDHHRVLQSMVEQYTVLPLRFGAVFASDDSMRPRSRRVTRRCAKRSNASTEHMNGESRSSAIGPSSSAV